MTNTSGLKMRDYNVLVKPDEVETKTKGGLFLTDQATDQNKHGSVRGTIIDASPMAFKFEDWDGGAYAEPGDKVILSKHAGMFVTGNDGVEYRVVKDKDIVAVVA